MAFVITSANMAGSQPIATNSTVKNHALGTVVTAWDPTYGGGEFIYLQGIGSTVVGSCVSYHVSGVTALAPVGTGKPQPIAFAMSACVASEYGWYQIGGLATAKKAVGTSLAAGAAVGVLTVGLIAATASAKEVHAALVAVVASAKSNVSTVLLSVNRPHMQGIQTIA
jgi:hypothetical protein